MCLVMAKNKPALFYPPDRVKKMSSLSYGEELAHLQMSLEEEAKSNCQVIMHAEVSIIECMMQ